eukprot:scaffold22457_cov47-Attheya_sp.AAC.4
MPLGCDEEFVKISDTIPFVKWPVPWSCFWTTDASVPIRPAFAFGSSLRRRANKIPAIIVSDARGNKRAKY